MYDCPLAVCNVRMYAVGLFATQRRQIEGVLSALGDAAEETPMLKPEPAPRPPPPLPELSFEQTDEDVTVSLAVPGPTKAKDVSVR
jgi:hypothetical protein